MSDLYRKSQYETILANLNWYMAKTSHLMVMIITDGAIKYTCICHQYDVISISLTINWHLLSDFSPIHSPVKEKEKQRRMKTHHDTIEKLNQDNRSVLTCQYCVLWGLILPLLHQGGKPADKVQLDFQIFKILYKYTVWTFILFDISAMLPQGHNCSSVVFCPVMLILTL